MQKLHKIQKYILKFKIYYLPQKSVFLKKKERKKYYSSKDKCPNFTKFLRTHKSNNLGLSNRKQTP